MTALLLFWKQNLTYCFMKFLYLLIVFLFSSVLFVNAQTSDKEETKTVTVVQNPPIPPGGLSEFYRFLAQEMKYPKKARKNKIQGKVMVECVIDETGKLVNPIVLKGIGYGCDEEAIRVLLLSPKWSPSTISGRPIKCNLTIPFTFSLR
jgi:TonB family protein